MVYASELVVRVGPRHVAIAQDHETNLERSTDDYPNLLHARASPRSTALAIRVSLADLTIPRVDNARRNPFGPSCVELPLDQLKTMQVHLPDRGEAGGTDDNSQNHSPHEIRSETGELMSPANDGIE